MQGGAGYFDKQDGKKPAYYVRAFGIDKDDGMQYPYISWVNRPKSFISSSGTYI